MEVKEKGESIVKPMLMLWPLGKAASGSVAKE